jgi:hypothetical protein
MSYSALSPASRDELRAVPQILGMVTNQINDARTINDRLVGILSRLRVSPPHAVKETAPIPETTLSTAAEMVSKAQGETFELLNEIERFI